MSGYGDGRTICFICQHALKEGTAIMGLSKTNSFKYFSLQPDMYISLSAFSLPAEFC